jgi:RecB family exonuclease
MVVTRFRAPLDVASIADRAGTPLRRGRRPGLARWRVWFSKPRREKPRPMTTYSHSRLAVYETCPRQYRYKYVDRVEVVDQDTAIQLYLGNRVHQALELLYNELQRGRLRSLEEILSTFRHQWDQQWPKSVRFPQPDDAPEAYRILAEGYLDAYYKRYHPFDTERTVAVERQLVFPLDELGTVRVQGYLDRLSIGPGDVWQIHDYKTSQFLPTQQQLDMDRQLALYQIGVQYAWPQARRVELVWHFLGPDVECRSERTQEQLRALRAGLLRLVEQIEADTEYRTAVGSHCDSCPYRALCPAWRHVVETSQLPAAQFQRDQGVQLVDRYAALKEEERLLGAQIETAQAELTAFARQHGFETIRGTEHKVTVKEQQVIRYPAKRDPDRTILERLVRDHGKWDEVSDLNLRAVAVRASAPEWPMALRDAVRRLGQLVSATRIRLGRLRREE